jgi:tetratricopeptide (TPR) repeat protein
MDSQTVTFSEALAIGVQHYRAGRFAEADAIFVRMLEKYPEQPDPLHLRGLIAMQAGRTEGAIALVRRAIAINGSVAEYHNNLSFLLHRSGELEQAIAAAQRAIEVKSDYPEAHYNLGNALRDTGRLDEAKSVYLESLRLRDEYPEAMNNLGCVLRELDELDESIALFRRAMALRPMYAEAQGNLGITLREKGYLGDAIVASKFALAIRSDYAEAQWNLGQCELARGKFGLGWPAYEARLYCKNRQYSPPVLNAPRWYGGDLMGQTILLCAEQGFGDAIQFSRYAQLMIRRGARIILQCRPELLTLFRSNPHLGRAIALDQTPGDFDAYCPLMSTPLAFKTDVRSVPAEVPYLWAEPNLAESWGERIKAGPEGLRVGLVWAGHQATPLDRRRSIALEELAPLGALKDVVFYSLQVGPFAARNAESPIRLIDLADDLKSFADTAAVISHLDLVISIDTAVAHLAGAMGKEVWLLLPAVADWRWMVDREDSPWYPNMRLIRQRTAGGWREVVGWVLEELLRKSQG